MDRALQNAMSRREGLVAELRQLQERTATVKRALDDADRFIADWHRYANTETMAAIEAPDTSRVNLPIDAPTENRRVTGNPKKEEVAETARAIIAERKEPVSRADLYQELMKRGVVVQGADPEKTLSTMLWRMRSRVARVRGGGYWLQEVPYAPADYVPERDGTDFEQLLATDLGTIPGLAPEGSEAVALQHRLTEDIEGGEAQKMSDTERQAIRGRLEELGY